MRAPKKLSVPAGVDLDALVADIRRKDKRTNVRDACCFILNYLVSHPLGHKGKKDADDFGGTPLNIKTLKRAVGRNATDAVNRLTQAGIISSPKNYSAGTHSRVYVLTELYQHQPLREVSVDAPTVVETLASEAEHQTALAEDAGISHLLAHLSPEFISVDTRAAHYYLEAWSELMYREVLTRFSGTKDKRKLERRTKLLMGLRRRIDNMKRQLSQFEKGLADVSRSPKNLRLQTRIVGLPSVLRNFLLFQGKPLVEVDMGAAQPLLLRSILSPSFWSDPDKGRHLHITRIFPHLHSTLLTPQQLTTIIVHTSEAACKPGYTSYSSLFDGGDFYENLMHHVASRYEDVPEGFKTRKQVKKTMMYILFEDFRGKKKEHHEAYQVFKHLFPEESSVLDTIKSAQANAVALLLQRFEAVLFLEHITKNIAEKHPQAYPLTIHDAVLTTEENAEVVRQEMESTVTDLLGTKPLLKMKTLAPEQVNRHLEENITRDLDLLTQKLRGKKYKVLAKQLLGDDSPLLLPEIPRWQDKTASTSRVWQKLLDDPVFREVYQAISVGMSLVGTAKPTDALREAPTLTSHPGVVHLREGDTTSTSGTAAAWEVIPVLGSLSTPSEE